MIEPRTRTLTLALILVALPVSVAFLLRDAHATASGGQESGADGPPVVRIIAPAANSSETWNSLVNYSVVVSYRGKSTQYEEIPAGQVLLKTTYVADVSRSAERATSTPDGLLDIIRSNCMGCHEFKARAMGPSFAAIAERYPDSQASIDTLSRYIRRGSTGVWGAASMTPHAEFSDEQLRDMALWIVKNAADPNVNYYVGTDGAFRMQAPAAAGPKSGMILTASYTSPDPPTEPSEARYGEATVILRGK